MACIFADRLGKDQPVFADDGRLERGMLYVVQFTDDADRAEVRQRRMPAHLDFLERDRERIRAAGPLKDADGSAAGGLRLGTGGSPHAGLGLVRADPFWPTGLRKTVRVLQWAQVFAEGHRLIPG